MAPFPRRQLAVLRFVADTGPATARQVTLDLQQDRTDVVNALRLLAAKGFVTVDHDSWPTSYAITDEGRAILAKGGE